MSAKQLYVICYDISDNARRRVVSGILEGNGMRVQESVFEVRAGRRRIVALTDTLKRKLRPGDNLRVYPLPISLLGECITVGGPPVAEANDFLLL